LRAFFGQRQASATSSDISKAGLDDLAARVAAMAKVAPVDPYCGLLDPAFLCREPPTIEIADPTRLDPARLEAMARAAEEAGLAIAGVTNSGGSGASWETGVTTYATTHGFTGAWRGATFGLGLSLIAERDGARERDYDGRSTRFLEDLPDPAEIGARAGRRTVERLGARKVASRTAHVIYENRVANRLIGPVLSAISGSAIARGVSFLKDKLGQSVFAPGVTITDDPLRPRGKGSRPFDGEGGRVASRDIIANGVLTGWLLNSAAARQLGLQPTGHATLGHGGPPGIGASNVTLKPGDKSLEALMAEAGDGLVITEMFSPALNANTGDYSVGVAGYWFEGGARAFPVSEVTVAGNLRDIYARLIPGADLEVRGALDAPSILVPDMAVAGV
jgi:PmbA protein